ncbi:MAG: hypothetical protein CVT92_00560 [Bacteroidetes bacterium HGW-Bacteroidetes-1]|jgi:hypothetical protein|nr:MAG: hypothetical protein CVT92_00560 [Bacteroidetes bacterium HGW-Bacteroidetes-1]
MSTQSENEPICCPPFDPKQWDEKILEWDNKKFIQDSVFTFFYMPVNFGQVMKRLDKKMTIVNATCPDYLCLSEHTSAWNMNLYLAVDKEVPNEKIISLSGKYYCKVYEGAFNNTGRWIKDFQKMASEKQMTLKKMYMWYTTCPKCGKKYGKNYIVIISEFV